LKDASWWKLLNEQTQIGTSKEICQIHQFRKAKVFLRCKILCTQVFTAEYGRHWEEVTLELPLKGRPKFLM
jgi:hypothetical protein